MDPTNLTYKKAIVFNLAPSKKHNSVASFSFFVSDPLAKLRFDSDLCFSYTRNPMSKSLCANSYLL
ncbi:hypothetical protein ACTXT7_001669 [Hymenolepis weldensis]